MHMGSPLVQRSFIDTIKNIRYTIDSFRRNEEVDKFIKLSSTLDTTSIINELVLIKALFHANHINDQDVGVAYLKKNAKTQECLSNWFVYLTIIGSVLLSADQIKKYILQERINKLKTRNPTDI
jgi:hypothetical protein